MPPASTGSFSNHLAPGIAAIIGTNLKSSETRWSQFWNMKSSVRNYEDVLAAAGLPIAPQKQEAGAITSVDPLEGNTKRLTWTEWGIGFEVTQTAWEDDLYKTSGSALRDASNGTADSLRERKEIEGHRALNSEGYTGTTFTVLPNNTETLFATSHVPIAGGEAAAQANRPNPDVQLSVTSFRDALIRFRKHVNDRGIRIPGFTSPASLIVPPDLEYVAGEILKSPMRPDTANNVANVTEGAVRVKVSEYITDTNSWAVQGTRHFMDYYSRSAARFDNFDDRRRRVAIFVAWERYGFWPLHWLGMDGTTGGS